MAWRKPTYSYVHAARAAGAAAITPDGSAGVDYTAAEIPYLIDDRMTVLFTWLTSNANHELVIDRGAGTLGYINRLYIPEGHTLNGARLLVESDDNSGFTSPATIYTEADISSADAVDVPLTTDNQRYVKVSFPTNSGAWAIGELWLTLKLEPLAGPVQRWTDELVPNVLQFDDGSSVQEDVDQRFVEYVYEGIDTALGITIFEPLIEAVSTLRPFILDSAYDVSGGGYTKVMKFTEGVKARHGSEVPNGGTRMKDFTLSMLEHLL